MGSLSQEGTHRDSRFWGRSPGVPGTAGHTGLPGPRAPTRRAPHPRRGRCRPPRAQGYLGDHDDLAGVRVRRLHDARHGAAAHGQATDQPCAAHGGHAGIADGEEDVGLRLGTALRGDLRGRRVASWAPAHASGTSTLGPAEATGGLVLRRGGGLLAGTRWGHEWEGQASAPTCIVAPMISVTLLGISLNGGKTRGDGRGRVSLGHVGHMGHSAHASGAGGQRSGGDDGQWTGSHG